MTCFMPKSSENLINKSVCRIGSVFCFDSGCRLRTSSEDLDDECDDEGHCSDSE